MALTEKQKIVLDLLRAEFERERASNFSQLWLIPSGRVRQFVDYFSSLSEPDKDVLAEALSGHAMAHFSSPENAHQKGDVAFKKYRDAYEKYCEAMAQTWDWKYTSIRLLRMSLAAVKLEPESRIARIMTDDVRKWIEAIKPVKSAEIRKAVKLALAQIISPLKITHPIEDWVYEGNLQGTMVSVAIDYSHPHYQLEYAVEIQNQKNDIRRQNLSYEQIMGLSFSHWDLLEQANLDQSITLLKEHIIRCANFLKHVSF